MTASSLVTSPAAHVCVLTLTSNTELGPWTAASLPRGPGLPPEPGWEGAAEWCEWGAGGVRVGRLLALPFEEALYVRV